MLDRIKNYLIIERTGFRLLHFTLASLLVVHFLIIGFYLLPNNPLKHQFKYEIEGYVNPFFGQSWNLFAPNPANTNTTILMSFEKYRGKQVDTTQWLDVVQPLLDRKRSSFWSPVQRVLKNMSTLTIGIAETNAKVYEYISETDSLSSDSVASAAFYQETITSSDSHQAIIQYATYVFNTLGETPQQYDSVRLRYRILYAEFPRFSQRSSDYFNKDNYKYTSTESISYRIF